MRVRFLVVIAAVIVAFSCSLFAQTESASLSGYVTDPTGAALVGAEVQVVNVETGVVQTTRTNGVGLYLFPSLQPGQYRMSVKSQGFKEFVKQGIVLHVQDAVAQNFKMEVGSASESITVTGGAPMVNTESAVVGTVVDRQFMENLPLNGRSFQSLLLLTPGVTATVNIQGINAGGSFSVNGQRAGSNGFMVDGVNANFAASTQTTGNLPVLSVLGTTQTLASVDDVQEFKVQTSTYNAEFGPQPGAQISIVTRSGSNAFHGSAFDYLRNDLFDANDWFADRAGQPKPPERQNDFGGTFGGPVWIPGLYNGKNRTFFFVSYEGLRLRLPQFVISNVPSNCLRGLGGCTTNVTPAVAAMLPILNAFPLPNGRVETTTATGTTPNGLAEFSSGFSLPSTSDTTSVRVDHNFGSRLNVFGRYNKSPSLQVNRLGTNLAVVGHNGLNTWTLTGGITATFSARTTNEFRINYSRSDSSGVSEQTTFGGAVPVDRSILIPSSLDGPTSMGSVTLSGSAFPGITAPLFPSINVPGNPTGSSRQFTFNDSFSWTLGTHQLKFGADYRHLAPVAGNNTYVLLVSFLTLSGIETGVAGAGGTIIQANQPIFPTFSQYSAFAQDTWKVTRRLTVNYGLRWDYIPPPGEQNGHLGVAVTQITNLSTLTFAPVGTSGWNAPTANFAPRFGVAYQLRQAAGHETVVRGGWGIFYDTGNERSTFNSTRFPWTSQKVLTTPVSYPVQASQVQATPVPQPFAPPFPTGLFVFDPNLKLPYTWQWNFAVEQALGASQKLTVSYVGAAARKLLQSVVTPIAAAPISNPNFVSGASVTLMRNKATSDYDGLQAQFQRRLSHGLQALASYTWSHALDEDSDPNTGRIAQHGNAAFDVRHVIGAAVTYDIPKPSNLLARAIFGYWSTDTSFHAQTAPPVDISATTIIDPATGGTISVRPNVVAGVPWYLHGDACTASNGNSLCPGGVRINPAAFVNPPAGQSGNLGRNQVRAQAVWQQDLAVRREFPIHESLKLQFRAEAFNIFNHPNFGFGSSLNGTIPSTLTSATFGEPTQMLNRSIGGMNQLYQIGGPRSFQFALKVLF